MRPTKGTTEPSSQSRAAKERLGTKLVHWSIQSNHIHLIVEAESQRALSRALQGLAVRLARRLNARIGRRGQLFPIDTMCTSYAHHSRSGELSCTS